MKHETISNTKESIRKIDLMCMVMPQTWLRFSDLSFFIMRPIRSFSKILVVPVGTYVFPS